MTRKSARAWMDTVFISLTLALFAYLMKRFSKVEDFPSLLQPLLKQELGSAIIGAVISVATFKIFFGLLAWLYRTFFENQIAFRNTSILGQWCYELDIDNKTPRIGECTIFLHNGTLKMKGVHWHPEEKVFTSNLDTTLIKVTYPEVFIRYVAVGIRDGEVDRDEGIFELQADPPSNFFVRPNKMTGIWTDVFPSPGRRANTGTFKLIRKTPDSMKTLKALGYPITATPSQIVFEQARKRAEPLKAA